MATFVVIHGAGDVASSWDLLAGELRDRGHDVVAVDLPSEDESAGWWDYAATIVDAIGEREDLVVVAHSLGGFVGPLVCAHVPARLLVLVAAMIPSPGETPGDWWVSSGHAEVAEDHGDVIATFMHDVPPQLAAAALAAGRDQAANVMAEPWPLEMWPDVPTRYLLCREDRVLPAEWARRHARERLGIDADEIDGAHCPFLSRPDELADWLDAAVGARAA